MPQMTKKKPVGRKGNEAPQTAAGVAKKKPSKKKTAARDEKNHLAKSAKKHSGRRRALSNTAVEEVFAVDNTEIAAAASDSADETAIVDAEIVAETLAAPEATAGAHSTPLTPEEQELQAIYGDDSAGAPRAAHQEYRDRQTRDEDRPMMPEINAREERKQHWIDRRERRKQRREERQQRRERNHFGQPRLPEAGPGPANQHAAKADSVNLNASLPPPAPQPAPTNGAQQGLARVGTSLGDAAATVFAQLRNNQPLPVRQLAAMMRKRSLVHQDPEQLWPQLKAELLGDERSYRTLGLRPRIVYRGRDLFAPGPVAMSVTATAEASVASAISALAGATHRALAQRIANASPAGFERLIHAYLVSAGYRDIDWIKRVDGIGYAQATAPGLERSVLISARSGNQPIDRRGVGELRVGVEAKDVVAGILFAARELSEEAEQELERPGRSISVVCGNLLVSTLIASGVGVVSAAAPMHYVDDQLLDELLAG